MPPMIYDVAVVGGGITGAGVVRDAALRGLSAVLIEKNSPGAATTASSTHLIHGGLRYLLFDRLTTQPHLRRPSKAPSPPRKPAAYFPAPPSPFTSPFESLCTPTLAAATKRSIARSISGSSKSR